MITFLRVYMMLGTSPHVTTHLIFTITLWSKYNYYPYFIDEQTKVHSSHSQDCSRQTNCKAWKLNPLPLKKQGQFLGPVSINISSICPRNVQKGSSDHEDVSSCAWSWASRLTKGNNTSKGKLAYTSCRFSILAWEEKLTLFPQTGRDSG